MDGVSDADQSDSMVPGPGRDSVMSRCLCQLPGTISTHLLMFADRSYMASLRERMHLLCLGNKTFGPGCCRSISEAEFMSISLYSGTFENPRIIFEAQIWAGPQRHWFDEPGKGQCNLHL